MSILDTGIKNVRNVVGYNIGEGAINGLEDLVKPLRTAGQPVVAYIDDFFITRPDIVAGLKLNEDDHIVFVKTKDEPSFLKAMLFSKVSFSFHLFKTVSANADRLSSFLVLNKFIGKLFFKI